MSITSSSKSKSVPLTRPRAVLFDWDGTIVSSLQAIAAALNKVQAEFGKPELPFDIAREKMALGTSKDILGHLHPEDPKRAMDIFYQHVPVLRAANLKVIDGAVAFLEMLRAQNIPIGIVSNMRHEYLVVEIETLGWTSWFETIVGAGEAARGKPSPDPIYLALERMGMLRGEAKDVWFVGDMETDEKAAKAAGCPFLFYTSEIDNKAEHNRLQAALTFHHYADVINVLKDLQ